MLRLVAACCGLLRLIVANRVSQCYAAQGKLLVECPQCAARPPGPAPPFLRVEEVRAAGAARRAPVRVRCGICMMAACNAGPVHGAVTASEKRTRRPFLRAGGGLTVGIIAALTEASHCHGA